MVEEIIIQPLEFCLVGFSDIPQWNGTILALFIFSYILTLLGNLLIILLIVVDSALHSPMYTFLCSLSLLDICSTTVTSPQVMDLYSATNYTVSFPSCISQVYFYLLFTNAEFLFLPVMAFDRFVAICYPLQYHSIMSRGVCVALAAAPWAFGILDTLSYTILTSRMSYCKSHVVNHFFCDLTSLLSLSCSDTSTIELNTSVEGYLFGFIPLFLTLGSYTYIIFNIAKIRSIDGRRKAFSTCSSHLIVIILFYGTIIFMYMRPASDYSPAQDKLLAVFYTNVIPVLNPLIYSLRNREVKSSFRKIIINKLLSVLARKP